MVLPAPFTLLVLVSLFWTSADSGGSVHLEEDRSGPCTATLTPEGMCRHGQDQSTCPYRFDIPPLTVHLPNQLKELEEILKDLQDLKDDVDELRKMCVDCNSSGKEYGNKDDSDWTDWTEGGRGCGTDGGKIIEAGRRTITEEKAIEKLREVKESDRLGLDALEKEDTKQERPGEKIKPDRADRKDKWEQTKPPAVDGNKRQEKLEREMNLDKEEADKVNLDASAGEKTQLGGGEKVKKQNNSNIPLLVRPNEGKNSVRDQMKMPDDKNEHMNEHEKSDGAEKKEEMGKSSKGEPNNERPSENTGHAGKPIKELDSDRGRIKMGDEKTLHGWTERESDGELTSSGAIERTDFVSIRPTSPSAIGPAQRKYSTVLDQTVTITSSLPSTPASRSTSAFMRDFTHGGKIISSTETPLAGMEVTTSQLMFTSSYAKNRISQTMTTNPSTKMYTTVFSQDNEKRTKEPEREPSQPPTIKPELERVDSNHKTELDHIEKNINQKPNSPPDLGTDLDNPDHTNLNTIHRLPTNPKQKTLQETTANQTPASISPSISARIPQIIKDVSTFDTVAQTRRPEISQRPQISKTTTSDKSQPKPQPGQNNTPGSNNTQINPKWSHEMEQNQNDSLHVKPKPDQNFEANTTHHRYEVITTSVSGQVAGSESIKSTDERPTPEPELTPAGKKTDPNPEADLDQISRTIPFTSGPETQIDRVTHSQRDLEKSESPNSRISSDLTSQTTAPPPSISATTRPNKIHRGIHQIPNQSVPDAEPSSQAKIHQSEGETAQGVMKTSPEAQTTSTLRNPIRTTTLSTFEPKIPAAVSSTPRTRELREKINQVAAFLNNSLSPREGPAGRFPKDHREDSKVLIPSKVPAARRDCSDHLLRGRTKSGVYLVTPDLRSRSFHVLCDMEAAGRGWTILQQRQDGSVSFNRTWAEYKSGFGELRGGEFWLGNNLIHWLTRDRDMVLRVELEDFEGVKGHAEYQQFSVASERMRFRLTVGDYSGTAGDALRSGDRYDHNNRAFTTPDRDHDRYPSGNCGAYYSSGWWFNACMSANLNGRYYVGKYKGVRDGIFWGTWHNILNELYPTNDRKSFKRVRMMTRPKDFGM